VNFTLLLQLAVSGLVGGAILALVAMGFALIYGASGHFHIAHIATITVSGYLAYLFADRLSLPFVLALLLTCLTAGAFGAAVYRLLYLPLERQGAERIMVFIVSLSLLIVSDNFILWIFGATPKRVEFEGLTARVDAGAVSLNVQQLLLIVLTLLLFAVIIIVTRRTKAGLLIRAVSSNPRLLLALAKQPTRIITSAYFIGSALTGVAGFFLAADAGTAPLRGHEFFVPAAMAVILGGVATMSGAFWLAVGIGIVSSVSVMWVSSGWAIALVFAVFIVGIVLRPQGLFIAPRT
jgi:branched-chain amino acid transport system permease protein